MKKLTVNGFVREWAGFEKDYEKHKRKINLYVNGVDFVVSGSAEPLYRDKPVFCFRNNYIKRI